MQNRTLRSAALLPALVISAVGLAPIARAQMSGAMDPGHLIQQGAKMAPEQNGAPAVPPPALPGATSRADTVAPATRIPTDMSPNDALFDAINRGDIAAARDALSRGADLSAQNLLGMTPMELSVDLGRNDISFLLLSYRGADSTPATGQAATAAPAASPKATAAKSAPRVKVVPVKANVPAAPQAPRLFASDGGAPVPGAGFLGFNPGR
jgi:ankyrin repeat protein